MDDVSTAKVRVKKFLRRHSTAEALEKSVVTRKKIDSLDICYGDIITIRKVNSLSVWGRSDDLENTDAPEFELDAQDTAGQFMSTEFGGVVDEGLIVSATNPTDPKPETLRTCLFRVLPKLAYFTAAKAETEKSDNSQDHLVNEHKIQANDNEDEIRFKFGQDVMYGDIVQLQHLATNKFITLKPQFASPYYPSQLKVQLESEGSQYAWLRLTPRFYNRSLGEDVQQHDEVIINFDAFAHDSDTAILDSLGRHVGCRSVPSSVSAEAMPSWNLKLFSSQSEIEVNTVEYGDIVTLYYPTLKCYLAMIDDSAVGVAQPTANDDTPDTTDEKVLDEMHKIAKTASREKLKVALLPLSWGPKSLVMAKSLWVVERAMDPSTGGAIQWDRMLDQVCLRHVRSGKYLGWDREVFCLEPVSVRSHAALLRLHYSGQIQRMGPLRSGGRVHVSAATLRKGRSRWLRAQYGLRSTERSLLTLEQCEVLCGVHWHSDVRRALMEIMKTRDSSTVTHDDMWWIARRYGFLEALGREKAEPDFYPLGSVDDDRVDEAVFTIGKLENDEMRQLHKAKEIMQHLQRMRVHLHEGTFPASTVSLKEDGGNSLLALESKVEVITEPLPPNTPPRKKKKRRKKLKRRETNRVQPSFNVKRLVDQLLQAAESIVYFILKTPEEPEHKQRKPNYRMRQLSEMQAKYAVEEQKQLYILGQDGLELLLDVICVLALGSAAQVVLSRRNTPEKTELAMQQLRTEIEKGKAFDAEPSLAMADALEALEWGQHGDPSRPRPFLSMDYTALGKTFYSIVRLLCRDNRAAESYCAQYMQAILDHFTVDIGAADTFAALTNNNRVLLENRVQAHHIEKFLNMIRINGKRPAYMRQLYSLCGYHDQPISSKQVQVCRHTMQYDTYKPGSILIKTLFSNGSTTIDRNLVRCHSKITADEVDLFMYKTANAAQDPPKGKALLDAGDQLGAFTLFLRWKGRMMQLYRKQVKKDADGGLLLPLHLLCENRRKEELTEPENIGERYAVYDYYCNQLELFCWMAKERNYYSMERLCRLLPFEMVLSGMVDRRLTYRVRGLFTYLMNILYVDRAPQRTRVLPELTRAAQFDADGVGTAGEFNQQSHVQMDQFAVLQAFIHDHYNEESTILGKNRALNMFTCRVSNLAAKLLDFGFYADHERVLILIEPIVRKMKNQVRARLLLHRQRSSHNNGQEIPQEATFPIPVPKVETESQQRRHKHRQKKRRRKKKRKHRKHRQDQVHPKGKDSDSETSGSEIQSDSVKAKSPPKKKKIKKIKKKTTNERIVDEIRYEYDSNTFHGQQALIAESNSARESLVERLRERKIRANSLEGNPADVDVPEELLSSSVKRRAVGLVGKEMSKPKTPLRMRSDSQFLLDQQVQQVYAKFDAAEQPGDKTDDGDADDNHGNIAEKALLARQALAFAGGLKAASADYSDVVPSSSNKSLVRIVLGMIRDNCANVQTFFNTFFKNLMAAEKWYIFVASMMYKSMNSMVNACLMFLIALVSGILGVADSLSMYAGYYDPLAWVHGRVPAVVVPSDVMYADPGERKRKAVQYFSAVMIIQIPLLVILTIESFLRFLGVTLMKADDFQSSQFWLIITTGFMDFLLLCAFAETSLLPVNAKPVTMLYIYLASSLLRPIIRALPVGRHIYQYWAEVKRKKEKGDTPIAYEKKTVSEVLKHRDDQLWLDRHAPEFSERERHMMVFTRAMTTPSVTRSLQLQLKLIHRVCLLMQDEVFKHILWKLVPACIDHLRTKDTNENVQTAPVISTARQQATAVLARKELRKLYHEMDDQGENSMTMCLLSLCLYPDRAVVSEAIALLMQFAQGTKQVIRVAKHTHVVHQEGYYHSFQSVVQCNRRLLNLVEGFETWGRLSDPRCAESFSEMKMLLHQLGNVIKLQPDASNEERKSDEGEVTEDVLPLLNRKVRSELVFFFVLHEGVEVAKATYGLVREWYKNDYMAGTIDPSYSQTHTEWLSEDPSLNALEQEPLTVAQGRKLMMGMLEALNRLVASSCKDEFRAQQAFSPLIPTLVRLLGRVPSACKAVSTILRGNHNLCYQVSDDTLQELVSTLRRCAPTPFLNHLVQQIEVPGAPSIFTMERDEEECRHKISMRVLEVLTLIVLNPNPLPKNQLRVLEALMSEKERLRQEVSMSTLKVGNYEEMLKTDKWKDSKMVMYHLGMLKLLMATAVGKINRTEAQGLKVLPVEELLDVVVRDDLPISYRTELMQVFFHLAVESEVRVRYLTKIVSVNRLLAQFSENMRALHSVVGDTPALLVKLATEGRLAHSDSMVERLLCPEIDGTELAGERLLVYCVRVVFPMLVHLFARYHADLMEVISSQRRSGVAFEARLIVRKLRHLLASSKAGYLDLELLYMMLGDLRALGKMKISASGDIATPSTAAQQEALLSEFGFDRPRTASVLDDVGSDTIAHAESTNADRDPMRQEFLRAIKAVKIDSIVLGCVEKEIAEAAELLTTAAKADSLAITPQYADVMWCALQHVLRGIQTLTRVRKGKADINTFRFEDSVQERVALLVAKFLRKVLSYITTRAEQAHSFEFAAKRRQLEHLQKSNPALCRELLADMKDARLSASYQEATKQGIPQAIEFGVVPFLLLLLRSGVPKKLRTNAIKLVKEMVNNFPADCLLLQKKILEALKGENHFFLSIKGLFKAANKYIYLRVEQVEAGVAISAPEPLHSLVETLDFLQVLTEGHYRDMQLVLLDQPFNERSYNILRLCTQTFRIVVTNHHDAQMPMILVKKVCMAITSLLTEAVQGPCRRTQAWLLANKAMLSQYNKLLQSMHKLSRENEPKYLVEFDSGAFEKEVRETDMEKVRDDVAQELTQIGVAGEWLVALTGFFRGGKQGESQRGFRVTDNVMADVAEGGKEDLVLGRVIAALPVDFFFKLSDGRDMTMREANAHNDDLEMALCDLVLALLEGYTNARTCVLVLDRLSFSFKHYFMKDLWVHASLVKHGHTRRREAKRLDRRSAKFIMMMRALADKYANCARTREWLTCATEAPVDSTVKEALPHGVRMCSAEYLRAWMGLLSPQEASKLAVTPMVDSIEVIWVNPDNDKRRLLSLYFPVPPSFALFGQDRLDEVTQQIQAGEQSAKLLQLLDHFWQLVGEVGHLKGLSRRGLDKMCSRKLLAWLDETAFCLACVINLVLVCSMVRPSSFAQSAFEYDIGFHIFQLVDSVPTLRRIVKLPRSFEFESKFYLPYLEAEVDTKVLSYMCVKVLSSLQLIVALLLVAEYFMVQWRADYHKEKKRRVTTILVHVSPYILHLAFSVLALMDVMVIGHALILVVKYIGWQPYAQMVLDSVFGTREDRGSSMQLGSTLIILLLSLLIVAVIIFLYLPKSLADQWDTCTTTYWSCALYTINDGMRYGGGIGEVLLAESFESHPDRWLLITFVLGWFCFVWVNAVLLNATFGIILDTFASRRDKEVEFKMERNNRCAICGLERSKFPAGHFKTFHVRDEHNRWSYLKYIMYLDEKDKAQLSGLEQYIWTKLKSNDAASTIDWFPKEMSWFLEKEKGHNDDDDDDDDDGNADG